MFFLQFRTAFFERVSACVIAETVARNVGNHMPGFSGVQKFEWDFQSSDMPCMMPSTTTVTHSQSVMDESGDQSQVECDQPFSEHPSEAEGSDVGTEKVSRRKPAKLKNDTIPDAKSGKEW